MSESFSNLLDESLSTLDMQPGSIVSGVVLDVDKDWVTVHVGLKSEGVISLDEFRNNEGTVDIEVGDEIEVALEAVEDGYGETRISREKARKISTWKMLEEALETGEFVTGRIHNRVKGGFAVEVDVVKAFLPGSLVDVRPVKEAPDIENTIQDFKVIKLDYKRNNVVLSRKAVLEKYNDKDIEFSGDPKKWESPKTITFEADPKKPGNLTIMASSGHPNADGCKNAGLLMSWEAENGNPWNNFGTNTSHWAGTGKKGKILRS